MHEKMKNEIHYQNPDTTIIRAVREHEFCYGHRVYEHESKCAHLHGHNARVVFYCQAPRLDAVGRVMDFSVIKSKLCQWLENNWDHKFIVYEKDPLADQLQALDEKVTKVPFNPTAENLANYLLTKIGPEQLSNTYSNLESPILCKVEWWETGKCAAIVELPYY